MENNKMIVLRIKEMIENSKQCQKELCSCEFSDKRFYDGLIHGLEDAKKLIMITEDSAKE